MVTTYTTATELLDDVLRQRLVRSVYQPLVDLETRQVLGYEALARGPEGSALESPDALFTAARACGRVAELDRMCGEAALDGARSGALAEDMALFVNAEPASMGAFPLPAVVGRPVRPVLEITERAIGDRPADLLASVVRARELGWGIAIDDIGAHPSSLALMPLLHPDVVKLDLSLVRHARRTDVAAVVGAVNAQAERSGAVVLAEGIETPEHLETARAMGATVGQGWLFGRPGPLPRTVPPSEPLERLDPPDMRDVPTPFAAVADERTMRTGRKSLLLAVTRHLENQALNLPEPPVVLSAFQDAQHFTAATARRYTDMGRWATLVAALGVGMANEPVVAVRGANLSPGDPLRGEWDVIVVGPHFAGALIARDLGDEGPDHDRRFRFVVTYERERVLRAARSLLVKVTAQAG